MRDRRCAPGTVGERGRGCARRRSALPSAACRLSSARHGRCRVAAARSSASTALASGVPCERDASTAARRCARPARRRRRRRGACAGSGPSFGRLGQARASSVARIGQGRAPRCRCVAGLGSKRAGDVVAGERAAPATELVEARADRARRASARRPRRPRTAATSGAGVGGADVGAQVGVELQLRCADRAQRRQVAAPRRRQHSASRSQRRPSATMPTARARSARQQQRHEPPELARAARRRARRRARITERRSASPSAAAARPAIENTPSCARPGKPENTQRREAAQRGQQAEPHGRPAARGQLRAAWPSSLVTAALPAQRARTGSGSRSRSRPPRRSASCRSRA